MGLRRTQEREPRAGGQMRGAAGLERSLRTSMRRLLLCAESCWRGGPFESCKAQVWHGEGCVSVPSSFPQVYVTWRTDTLEVGRPRRGMLTRHEIQTEQREKSNGPTGTCWGDRSTDLTASQTWEWEAGHCKGGNCISPSLERSVAQLIWISAQDTVVGAKRLLWGWLEKSSCS